MVKNLVHRKVELRQFALDLLIETNPAIKTVNLNSLNQSGINIKTYIDTAHHIVCFLPIPGRPPLPKLVAPTAVKKRSMRTDEGRAALIHALAHIEFNAINLALDAVWRFSDMPEKYYTDWIKVAAEEAYHFSLLSERLNTMGYAYGDFDGHNSLWEMVERTQDDVLARMALVPRTMEARGLDASPPLRNKFAQINDHAMTDTLDIIMRDEVGHVAIGNHWFNWLCQQRQLDPISTFDSLCVQYRAPKLKPPFNMEARRKAGFTEQELAYLNGEFV